MRLDRLQSRTVQAIHCRAQSPPKEVVVKEEEGVEEKEVVPKEEQRMSSSPSVSGQFIGGSVSNFTSALSSNFKPANICVRSRNPYFE